MENIRGTLKSLRTNSVYSNVKCEFEFDFYGGIKDGFFPDLLSGQHCEVFIGKYFCFKNDDIVMNIYINRIENDNVHFQTVRFKKITNRVGTNKLTVFVTKTELFFNQMLNIEGYELLLTDYDILSTVEYKNMGGLNSNLIIKFKNVVEDVLLYVQLLQLKYCEIFGYKYENKLYIDYRYSKSKPFIYRYAETFKKEDAELFIDKFRNSPYKDHLTKIIYRLISAKMSNILEIRYLWLIFALEAIESVYNMKKGTDIRTSSSKNHIHFNKIIDDILPENSLMKIYFGKNNYWKSLLWVYRDKYVHFLRNVDDLNEKPDKGQEKKLEYIFKDDYNVLTKEFKELLPIAQRIICEILDIDYEESFLQIQ